jgi:hypothetical protein
VRAGAAQGGTRIEQPVVHFEVMGRDGERLRSYYSELFGLDQVPGTDVEIGQLLDPEGHMVEVMRTVPA